MTQKTIPTTSVHDLDQRPCADNAHVSILPHEMTAIEPVENPTRTLTWKSLDFRNHIKSRTNDDRFPLPRFCSSLGVPIPVLIGPPQQCVCNDFHYDLYGDHLQTCQAHDWVGYRLGTLFGSVGHQVKIHKITPATGKERDDIGCSQ